MIIMCKSEREKVRNSMCDVQEQMTMVIIVIINIIMLNKNQKDGMLSLPFYV